MVVERLVNTVFVVLKVTRLSTVLFCRKLSTCTFSSGRVGRVLLALQKGKWVDIQLRTDVTRV